MNKGVRQFDELKLITTMMVLAKKVRAVPAAVAHQAVPVAVNSSRLIPFSKITKVILKI